MTIRHHRSIFITLTAGVLTSVALAGCTGGGKNGTQPTVSNAAPSPSSTVTAEQTAAGKQAVAAYNAYVEYLVKAQTSGVYKREEMVRFTGEPLLGNQINALASQQQAGVRFQGRPTWTPQVAEVDLQAKPAVVTLTDCFDTTAYTPVRDGKPVPGQSGSSKRPLVIKVKLVSDVWYVYESKSSGSQSC